MKQVILIVSFILIIIIFAIPAFAESDTGKSSIGVNYTMTNDGWGTRGSGVGIQLNINTQKYTDAPIDIRVAYMNLNGTYSPSGIAWGASVIGIACILNWENPNKNYWIKPYAGMGIASVTIDTTAVGVTKSLFSPVTTVGTKINTGTDVEPYIEINAITGNMTGTLGMNYKF